MYIIHIITLSRTIKTIPTRGLVVTNCERNWHTAFIN